ncbi:hypothetical protein D5S19_01125 [Amycolatopsis panacis]|uniref:Uncharacterized protein n=1 Tax=Amycolatopsis panacis TaxID=2340917 RepID=A0A419IC10_9PSEU|nr:hypothetical protein D5S19_01125 [Amycolatopsis panacis]
MDNCEAGSRPPTDERHDERHGALVFASRILSSWGYTARVSALISILLAILISSIGLMRLTIDVGPVRITGTLTTGEPQR